MLKNLFSYVSLTTFLFLTMTGISFAAQFQFPSKIKYDIFVGGTKSASSDFAVESPRSKAGMLPMYRLSFGNFQGLGFTSRDKIYTVVFQDTLSLSKTMLIRGKEKVYEMKAKKAQGMFGDEETDVFVYQEESLAGPIETEPYTPYPVIDLLSLFLVASESVATGKKGPQNLSFFVKRSTEVVQLEQVGNASISYQGQTVQTTKVVLTYQGREAFKLYIYRDKNGFSFPVQFSIDDEQQGLVELRATKAF